MLPRYHSGAFGKDVPGQWSCCKQEKCAKGCRKVVSLERTQSDLCWDQKSRSKYASSAYEEVTTSVPSPGFLEGSGRMMVVSGSLPINYVQFERVSDSPDSLQERIFPPDTQSLKSAGKTVRRHRNVVT